jgi:hypothetical protein
VHIVLSFDAFFAQHALPPPANTGDAISATANTAVPMNLTMVTDQTDLQIKPFNSNSLPRTPFASTNRRLNRQHADPVN